MIGGSVSRQHESRATCTHTGVLTRADSGFTTENKTDIDAHHCEFGGLRLGFWFEPIEIRIRGWQQVWSKADVSPATRQRSIRGQVLGWVR